jgi:hypothetical protein
MKLLERLLSWPATKRTELRLEDVFRFLESRMPGTQAPDGTLRRSITMVGWDKLKLDLTEVLKKSGGIHLDVPKEKALVVVEEPTGPAEVNDEIFPVINGENHPRSFV